LSDGNKVLWKESGAGEQIALLRSTLEARRMSAYAFVQQLDKRLREITKISILHCYPKFILLLPLIIFERESP